MKTTFLDSVLKSAAEVDPEQIAANKLRSAEARLRHIQEAPGALRNLLPSQATVEGLKAGVGTALGNTAANVAGAASQIAAPVSDAARTVAQSIGIVPSDAEIGAQKDIEAAHAALENARARRAETDRMVINSDNGRGNRRGPAATRRMLDAQREAGKLETSPFLAKLQNWAAEDSGILGLNKGTATGLGVGAAGLIAYLLSQKEEKKKQLKTAGLFGAAGNAVMGAGRRAGNAVKSVFTSPRMKSAIKPASITAGVGAAGAGGYFGGKALYNAGEAAGYNRGLNDHTGQAQNLWDKTKGWAAEDSGILGLNKGTATGLGVGAAGLLAYMLTRDDD